jgi:hypothetical protein
MQTYVSVLLNSLSKVLLFDILAAETKPHACFLYFIAEFYFTIYNERGKEAPHRQEDA